MSNLEGSERVVLWWEDFDSDWCYECTMDHTWPSCKAGSTNRSLSRAAGADSFWRCHEDLHLQRALQACLGSQNPTDHCPSISWTGLSKKTQPAPCPASAWLAARAGCKSRFFRKSFQVETTFGLQSQCLRQGSQNRGCPQPRVLVDVILFLKIGELDFPQTP